MIVLTLEGGLVQSVSSDDPLLVGQQVAVIDYDIEGADSDEVEQVPQDGGKSAEAAISMHEVGRLHVAVADFLKTRPG